MKLMVMIPCFNEEDTLPATMRDIPRAMAGVDHIEVLIVDDGCTDGTVEVARTIGVDWVARHVRNRGLAAAFQTGLDACLQLGADIIVTTDGDNQYPQAEIPRLVEPILSGAADIVVGDRQTSTIAHFSPLKKLLQAFGSWVMRQASGTTVPDAPSGFRAYSRDAALRLNVITQYTYTLETLIQAGRKNLAVQHIAIRTNPQLRQSRLVRGLWDYVKKQGATIVRLYALYEPLKVFVYLSLFFLIVGAIPLLRFAYFYFVLDQLGTRYVQSLIIGSMLIVVGVLLFAIGLLADLNASSRRLLEDVLYRVKKLELQQGPRPLADAETQPLQSIGATSRPRATTPVARPHLGEALPLSQPTETSERP